MDGKTKKRIQNRVAQRSYRVFWATKSWAPLMLMLISGQRMKTRVEELQAKVDIFERGRLHGQSRSMNAQSDSQSSPNASNAVL